MGWCASMAKAERWRYGPKDAYSVQTLARHQAIARLLADIATDMQICRIEGWDVWEYPRMIRDALPSENEL